MTATVRSTAPAAPARRLWFPHQHGAWAMLAVPLLLGVAASRPDGWQLALALTAVAGYLASATAQTWLRARRRPTYVPSLVAYGGTFAVIGTLLVATHPELLATGVIVAPAAAIALGGSRPGTKRDLVNSIAQAAIALALVPAAAMLAGPLDGPTVAGAMAVATVYLVGTVLVVRSVIRERNNSGFAVVSAAWHVVATVLALVTLPIAYAAVAALLTARAIALPILVRRRLGTPRPIRPVHVGMLEIVAAVALVGTAFLAAPTLR